MRGILFLAATLLAFSFALVAKQAAAGDLSKGRGLFQQKCGSCHSVDPNRGSAFGPNLSGIFKRKRGSLPGYDYSPAMKALKGPWTDQLLDKFLASPGSAVPGTRMPIAIDDAPERQQIIAFLENSASPDGREPAQAR